MQSWLEGRNCEGKGAQATEMTTSLRILSSKADSNTWESFTRSELKLESPCSDIFRKRATKPLLKQKHRQTHLTWAEEKNNWTVAQWSKVLFSDKSKFCISLWNQDLESGGRLERHRINAAWSPVWSFHSQWWFWVPWRLLVLVHFVLSSPKSMQSSTWRFLSTLSFHLLTSYLEMLISFSSRTLAPAQCQNHFQLVCWPWYYWAWLASQHAWPEPHLESMGYFQEKDEKQSIQQYRRAEDSIVPQQSHRLIASMPHLTDAGVWTKEPRPSIECINEHTLKNFNFFDLQILFWLMVGNILIFWDTRFFTFLSCKL